MQNENFKTKRNLVDGLLFGILLIAVGVLLFAFNAGVLMLEWKAIIISWPMLGVVVGLILMIKKHFFGGFVAFFFSMYFLLPKIGYIYPDFFFFKNFEKYYWAMFFFIIGVFIIFLPSRIRQKWNCKRNRSQNDWGKQLNQNVDGQVNIITSFSAIEEVVLDTEFKGGKIDVSFGEVTLDLRRTSLKEGVTELRIDCHFAGINLIIPEEWNIRVEKQMSFGGISDKRLSSRKPIDMSRELLIYIRCSFAGCEIK